jgi:signal transduction histidine kinase
LIGPINETARLGDLGKLTEFCNRWIADELQLAEARLTLFGNDGNSPRLLASSTHMSEETLMVRRGAEFLGTLRVRSHGAMISGETYAALELVCEQLPAAVDLCRSIDEKLQLERDFAERERLALVGQMAASISHNLKNPLGSIKTILQLQLERPELPDTMRRETQMVLDEIGRLSAKLNQLLQFSRPGLRLVGAARCDLARVAQDVAEVFRHEAQEKGAALEWPATIESCWVAASAEGVNDIVSNVMINAIEAVERGGHVKMRIARNGMNCDLEIEDDGPGIAAGAREKMLRPFFTTKPRGTGLGLAIVQRRLEEISGRLEAESPIEHGRGTRFRLTFPLATLTEQGNEGAG